ncbi:peptidoglycan recognition protein [Streptomyces sp. NPDC057411]|uniref:peptidoglycan recognition protein family protein n=1 Tax=unclassified Streptomyces TaxID=2593676 RepID=UPI003626C057
MRANLASSIAVSCAAVLALPLALTAPAGAATPAAVPPSAAEPAGSTQSLPLEPLAVPRDRVLGSAAGAARGLTRRDVRPFSLVGVVWDDVHAPLHGTVQVRTRATGGGWSDWQSVETHNDEHGADPGTAEGHSGALHGSTAPLWVGDSDGVELRVVPEEGRATRLPEGLRLELVDPGRAPGDAAAPADPAAVADRAAPADRAIQAVRAPAAAAAAPSAALELPPLTRAQTLAQLPDAAAKPYIGPRPRIITRKGWGADERLREKGFVYTKTIKAVFVHHSATGNRYTCAQAPSVLRAIYRYHVKSSGWRDFGYNFAVDKCGNIYEGRAGGVAKPVLGAHTMGFNNNSMGVAVLGTYGGTTPPAAAVNAVARLTAWKLGLHGVNPKGKTYLTSGGGNLYKKGRKVRFNVIAGHRDGFATECPGGRLYGKLGTARSASAKYQGRR